VNNVGTRNAEADGNEIQAAIDAGLAIGEPKKLDAAGRFFSVVSPAGAFHTVIDLEQAEEKFRETPRRKTGGYAAHTAEAFIAYMAKHVTPTSEVWADLTSRSVTAVINAHDGTGGEAGWGDHRLQLQLQHTAAWKAWTGLNGEWLSQTKLAELLEERAADIVDPDAATLTEITRSFKAAKKVAFESGTHLSTGEVQFVYREEIEGKAGKKGELSIPEQFTIALTPFEGGKPYAVLVRLRYSINEGGLVLKYVLDRPAEYMATAFNDVVDIIRAGVDAPLFHGKSG
jgi:uncharacterized protein YfdQ (DUF2303 family)